MNIKVLALALGFAIFMNGCLTDKIRQRIYYLKMKDGTYKKVKVKKSIGKLYKTKKAQKRVTQEHPELRNVSVKNRLYMPSKGELLRPIEEVEVVTLGQQKDYTKSVTKKRKIKKSTTSVKKKVTSKKRVVKKKIKDKPEPYSIGSDESDPELLGPQTTLESNPLKKTGDKI